MILLYNENTDISFPYSFVIQSFRGGHDDYESYKLISPVVHGSRLHYNRQMASLVECFVRQTPPAMGCGYMGCGYTTFLNG